MVGAKTAQPNAFRKAAQMGTKIILHTDIEDVMERLAGDITDFHRIVKTIPGPAGTGWSLSERIKVVSL